MAMTGALLLVFVVGHLLGNLQIFCGPDSINSYAAFLKSKPGLLWSTRLGLLATVLVHLGSAALLLRDNRAAREQQHAMSDLVAASLASRTMIMSGLIVFAFVVYHLLHFTVGKVDASYLELRDSSGRHDVYRMMIAGLSKGWIAAFYVLGVGLLCLHLSHGIGAMAQSLGLKTEANAMWIDGAAKIVAVVLFVGYVSIPAAILLGWVK